MVVGRKGNGVTILRAIIISDKYEMSDRSVTKVAWTRFARH